MHQKNKETIWSRDFVLLLAVNGITFFSFQVLLPLLPVYGQLFTASDIILGILVSAIAIAALIIRPLAGLFADRGNRKIIIAVAQLATAVLIALFSVTTSIQGLIALRFAHGVVFGIVTTSVMLSAVQTLPEARLGRGIGMLGVTTICGQAVAPALGIFLVDNFGYTTLFLVTASVSAAAVLPALIVRPQPRIMSSEPGISIRNFFAVEGLGVAVLILIFTTGISAVLNYLVLFGNSRGIANIGFYFTIYAAVLVICRVFGGGLADKYPLWKISGMCAVASASGLFLVASAHSFSLIAVAAVLLGIGHGLSNPAFLAEIIRSVPPDRRGAASATTYIAMDAANIICPLAMGVIASAFDYGAGFYFMGGPILVTIPIVYLAARKKERGAGDKGAP